MVKNWMAIYIFLLAVSVVVYINSEHPSSFPLDDKYIGNYEYYGYVIGFIAGGAIQLLILCMIITYIPVLIYWLVMRKILPIIKTLAWVIAVLLSITIILLIYL